VLVAPTLPPAPDRAALPATWIVPAAVLSPWRTLLAAAAAPVAEWPGLRERASALLDRYIDLDMEAELDRV
jgi:hypothetical protein